MELEGKSDLFYDFISKPSSPKKKYGNKGKESKESEEGNIDMSGKITSDGMEIENDLNITLSNKFCDEKLIYWIYLLR